MTSQLDRMLLRLFAIGALVACTPRMPQSTQTLTAPLEPPASYDGLPLPTVPAIAGNESLPSAWLVAGGQAIHGTLLAFRLSTGQEFAQNDPIPNATVALAPEAPAVLVGPTSITALLARFTGDGAPHTYVVRHLQAEGRRQAEMAVFTLDPIGYAGDEYLRVRFDFTGPVTGAVEYGWQFIWAGESRLATPTPIAVAGAPLACVRPTAGAEPRIEASGATPVQPETPAVETWARVSDLVILGTAAGPAVVLKQPGRPGDFAPLIVTDTPILVECALKGSLSGATLNQRAEGGCIGDDCMYVSHGGPPALGQRLVMFLRHEGPDYTTVLRQDGTYEVQSGPDYYVSIDGYVIEAGQAMSQASNFQLPLAELIARIDGAEP